MDFITSSCTRHLRMLLQSSWSMILIGVDGFVDGNGENRFGEEPDRPLVLLTSTDHDVP